MKFRIWVQYGIAQMSHDYDVASISSQKEAEKFAEALVNTWNAEDALVKKKDPLIGVLLRVEMLGESSGHRWKVLTKFTSSSGIKGEMLSCARCGITAKRADDGEIKRVWRYRAKKYDICSTGAAA